MKKLLSIIILSSLLTLPAHATSFKDLSASHKNAAAIEAMANLNIIKGDSNSGNFAPERTLNRAEFAKIIILAIGESVDNIQFKSTFPDVKESDWFAPYIIRANELGIIKGTGEGKAEPAQAVKTVEALAMALRAYNVSVEENGDNWYQPYLDQAQSDNLLLKVATNFDKGLPRSEAAQMIVNAMSQYKGFQIPASITADLEATKTESVSVNGKTLSQTEITNLATSYGGDVQPGDYWYDSRSGLAGKIGEPLQWFMKPGHKFGTMPSNASSGDTGVYLNGRELPQLELALYTYLVGSIAPGSYWLDSNGNAGIEGNNTPLVNLLAAAGVNQGTSSSSGGDNFWSAGQYSAGNNYDNNTSGYAFVPGVGAVGYGELR